MLLGRIFIVLAMLFCGLPLTLAEPTTHPSGHISKRTLDPVKIQLKWKHQFQFAGYYAAIEKGFYAEEGLDVSLVEYQGAKDNIEQVASGKAEYGISDSTLIIAALNKRPVVLLSQIFQRSPLIVLTRSDSNIEDAEDLKNTTLALESTTGSAAIEAMINNALGSMKEIRKTTYGSVSIKDLTDKKVDAVMASISNQPYYLIQKGIDFNIIKPQSYGIDFYGDNLFTSKAELRNHPSRVRKMIRATIKGWEYALNNPDEIIDIIRAKYLPLADPAKLKYEARYVREMILPNLFQIGFKDPKRINRIAETYQKLNYAPQVALPPFFIYKENKGLDRLNLSTTEEDWIRQNPTVVYGAEEEWAPFDFTDKNGKHIGVSRSFLDKIEGLTGIKFEPKIDLWENLMRDALAGEITLLPAISFTKERAKQFVFSDYYTANTPYFFALADHNYHSIEDLIGKTVALPKGYSYISTILQNYPTLKILETKNLDGAVTALIEGRADLIVDSLSALNYFLNKQGIGSIKAFLPILENTADGVYMATNKDNAILISIINKALRAIPTAEKQAILKYWLGVSEIDNAEERIQLSPSEQLWLSNHKTIRYAGDPNWLPFEGYDNNGRYTGIVSDYLKIIQQKLGIEIDIVRTSSWQETLAKFKSGEIDMISETIDSSLTQNHSYTKGYLSNPVVILSLDSEHYIDSLSELDGKKIGFIKDFGYGNKIKRDHPSLNFVEVADIHNGFIALSTGKIDFLLSTVGNATYQISEQGYNNIRIVGKTGHNTELGFLVNSKYDPLIPILNKALNNITPKKKKAIKDSWGQEKFTTRIDYSLIWKIITIALVLALIAWFWIRMLSKEVGRRKKSEKELQLANKQFILAADAAAIGFWQLYCPKNKKSDPIIVTDERSQTLYDIPLGEKLDWNTWVERVPNTDRAAFNDFIMSAAHDHPDESSQGEFKIILPSGETRHIFSAMLREPANEDDKNIKLVGISWDITNMKRSEEALKKAKTEAENANKAKSEFLSNMSHEIRTPMNSIIGFTELLDERIDDHNSKAFIKTIRSAGKSLLSIINDILDLSKIEAGKLEIVKEPTDIHALMEDISNIFMMRVREKNLDLIVEVSPRIPSSLLIDETRLRQILFNLIGNAVKFTEEGYIKIRAESENEDEIRSKLDLVIHIQDTGIGIPEDEKNKIFNAFEQLSGQSVKKYGGTGLGLPISLRLANMMGGEVTLDSRLNEGSLFSLRLKSVDISAFEHVKEDNHDIQYQSIEFKPCRILIVDDVEDNRNLLISNFEQKGIDTECACNGLDAVNKAKSGQFDLILMDIRMPIMNGYEAAENIRSFSDTPIVALTASVMADEFERQKRDLFNGFLRKPVLRTDLFNELIKFLDYELSDDSPIEEYNINRPFSDGELARIEPYFSQYQALATTAESLEDSNNINDIKAFNHNLTTLLENYPIDVLTKLNQELDADLSSFNIAGIKKAVHEFPKIVYKIKTSLANQF